MKLYKQILTIELSWEEDYPGQATNYAETIRQAYEQPLDNDQGYKVVKVTTTIEEDTTMENEYYTKLTNDFMTAWKPSESKGSPYWNTWFERFSKMDESFMADDDTMRIIISIMGLGTVLKRFIVKATCDYKWSEKSVDKRIAQLKELV